MARGGKQSDQENPFDVKMKPYDEALADLKETIERHVKKDAKYRRRVNDVQPPTVYKIVPRTEV